MSGTLRVKLGRVAVGELVNILGDYNIFAFAEEYIDDYQRPILSQSLIGPDGHPRRKIPRTHVITPPFFANLLPESDGLLRSMIARQYEIKPTRDFPFLAHLGTDLPGAVEIEILGDFDEAREAQPQREQLPLPQTDIRFSLAGMQLKFSVSMRHERLTLPAQGNNSRWIIKLPTATRPYLPENEFYMMSLAAEMGLNVPQIRLVDLSTIEGLPENLPELHEDEPNLVYAIERFDRGPNGARTHYEDLNQIADQWPDKKYDNKPTHWVAGVVRTLCSTYDVDEFLARLTFGICIGNNDMHLKNWAVSYPNGRQAVLSPMYDFLCTTHYFNGAPLALTVGGERSFSRIDMSRMEELAKRAAISVARTRVVVRETVEKLRISWPAIRSRIPHQDLIESVEKNFARVPLMQLK